MTTTQEAVRRYFEAWAAKDFDALRDLLADDVTFRGPLGQADGADACIRGLRGRRLILHLECQRHESQA